MNLKRSIFLLAALVVVLASCTNNRPWRRDLVASSTDPTATIETHDVGGNESFKIGFVEFDDQGWFWGHRQWETIRQAITNEADTGSNGMTLVVFVHGWKNNAADDDTNVSTFRGVLTNLCRELAPRQVFGVYLGWRGLSTISDYFPPLGKEASFFQRKAVAERVGHQGAATQVFSELQIIEDNFNHVQTPTNVVSTPATNSNRMVLVIIGHSFGSQLVFSAISQGLTERLATRTFEEARARLKGREAPPLKSFGDLVILLSPAFEASLYNNVISQATSSEINYPTNQKPVLAMFTSQGDWATHYAFPFGRFFSTWFQLTRPSKGPEETNLFSIPKGETPDQRQAIKQTVGWDSEYVTYDLNFTNYGTNIDRWREDRAGPSPTPDTALALNYADMETNKPAVTASPTNLVPLIFADTTVSNISSSNTVSYYSSFFLKPREKERYSARLIKPGNPFLNVQVNTSIMKDHDDIANPVLIKFLGDFIEYSLSTNSTGRFRR